MALNVIYTQEKFPNPKLEPTIALAGPTPRTKSVKSWRPKAIECFRDLKFDGYLFVPEDRSGECKTDYIDQVEWELQMLEESWAIMFWIPRNLETMPGFTTNDEWGCYKKSGKVVLGVPSGAPKCKYQIYYAKKLNVPFSEQLEETCKNAINMAYHRYSENVKYDDSDLSEEVI